MDPAMIEAAGSIASSISSGLFGYNQAAKNRSFQERMYYQQLADNRKNWEMVNQYNLPSAQVARLRDANLSPYLMYSNGNISNVANSSEGASAPSGAQSNVQFQNPFSGFTVNQAMMAKLDAEIQKLRAEKDKTESETNWNKLETKWQMESWDLRRMIMHGEYDLARAKVRDIDDQIFNRGVMTTAQAATLAQARIYEIKRFDLDSFQVTESLKQRWEDIKSGRIAANAALKNACASWLNAVTNSSEAQWRIGAMAQDIYYKSLEQPYKLKNMSLQNMLNKFDVGIKAYDILKSSRELKMYDYTGGYEMPSWAVPLFFMSGRLFGRIPNDYSNTY